MNRFLLILTLAALVCGCVGPAADQNSSGSDGQATSTPSGGLPGISGADWCPVGHTQTMPGATGTVQVKVVGTETIDGVNYCKSVFDGDSKTGKVEAFWTTDGDKMITNIYGTDGKLLGKMVTDKTANTLKSYGPDGELQFEMPLDS